MFFGESKFLSKVLLENVTRPNGEPPDGGVKIPFTTSCSFVPRGVVNAIGEPRFRWCDFA